MRSPKEMQIIQIEITNACVYACSNCTRMCGHHKKTFMMDFETFKRAVDSLEGYQGCVSLMGGEPTLHPEFEKFALYLKSKYPHLYEEGEQVPLARPATDFMEKVDDIFVEHIKVVETKDRPIGLASVPCVYSTTCDTYLKHYELIQDVFKRQVLNDHSNEMYHQPALISRKDLGIPDEEWIPLRDECWIQNTWSASVTPKGAFFCEIAAALDILFEGPGGWPIEKDWWKKEPEDFKDQLHWCELCGFACETFTRKANERVDDVSPILYEKLKEVGSPKAKAGNVNVIDIKDGVISEESKASGAAYDSVSIKTGMAYVKNQAEKFDTAKSILHPDRYIAFYHLSKDTTKEQMETCQTSMKKNFAHSYVFCETSAVFSQWKELETAEGTETSYDLTQEVYGQILNKLLPEMKNRDYLVALSETYQVTETFLEKFKEATPNPGSLIYGKNVSSQWIESSEMSGFVGIFNKNASSIKVMGFDRRSRMRSFEDFATLWKKEKSVPFDEDLFLRPSKERIKEGQRCVIFGASGRAKDLMHKIKVQKAVCLAIVDSDCEKQGKEYEGFVLQAPEVLKDMVEDIDLAITSSFVFADEMKTTLLEFGFPEEKIIKL